MQSHTTMSPLHYEESGWNIWFSAQHAEKITDLKYFRFLSIVSVLQIVSKDCTRARTQT
jgi:hypothetical protein